jgi:hypothetical protein
VAGILQSDRIPGDVLKGSSEVKTSILFAALIFACSSNDVAAVDAYATGGASSVAIGSTGGNGNASGGALSTGGNGNASGGALSTGGKGNAPGGASSTGGKGNAPGGASSTGGLTGAAGATGVKLIPDTITKPQLDSNGAVVCQCQTYAGPAHPIQWYCSARQPVIGQSCADAQIACLYDTIPGVNVPAGTLISFEIICET